MRESELVLSQPSGSYSFVCCYPNLTYQDEEFIHGIRFPVHVSVSSIRHVVGKAPKSAITQEMLDTLAEHALKEQEFGVPEEVEYGWSGGRHVFDAQFSFEHNVFADALHFALRIDTNKGSRRA